MMDIEEDRMPDLPMKTQPAPPQAAQPRAQTRAPQPSTAQRRANQAGQPRDRIGRYGEKVSKWKQHLLGGSDPTAPTALKKVDKPARPTTKRQPLPRPASSKRARPLPSMAAMIDRPLHHKVGYVVRRWFRRKKHHFKALFSLRG